MKCLKKTIAIVFAGLSLVIFIASILIMIVGIRAIKNNELFYILNYSFSVVADTKSMEGNLNDSLEGYDIAVIKNATYSDIQIGKIIVFKSITDGRLVIHRVIGEHALGGYETKGDSNHSPDPYPVTEENFQGIYASKITFLKPVARLATESRSAIFGLIALVLLVLLITELFNIFKQMNQQKLELLKKEHDAEIERIKSLEKENIIQEFGIKKNHHHESNSID
jgi:signal peptidase